MVSQEISYQAPPDPRLAQFIESVSVPVESTNANLDASGIPERLDRMEATLMSAIKQPAGTLGMVDGDLLSGVAFPSSQSQVNVSINYRQFASRQSI